MATGGAEITITGTSPSGAERTDLYWGDPLAGGAWFGRVFGAQVDWQFTTEVPLSRVGSQQVYARVAMTAGGYHVPPPLAVTVADPAASLVAEYGPAILCVGGRYGDTHLNLSDAVVTQWSDVSGNARHLVPCVDGHGPERVTHGIDSAVSCRKSVDTQAALEVPTAVTSGVSQLTMIVVARTLQAAADVSNVWYAQDSGTDDFRLNRVISTHRIYASVGPSRFVSWEYSPYPASGEETLEVLVLRFDGTFIDADPDTQNYGRLRLWRNWVEQSPTSTGSSAVLSDIPEATRCVLGANTDDYDELAQSDYYLFCVIHDALDPSVIEGDLRERVRQLVKWTSTRTRTITGADVYTGNALSVGGFATTLWTDVGNAVQYAAWYETAGYYAALGKRALGSEAWTTHVTDVANTTDAHNNLCVWTCGGIPHLSIGGHNEPHVWLQGASVGDIELDAEDVLSTPIVVDGPESSCTYAQAYHQPDGDVHIVFRNGASGNGNTHWYRQDAASGEFSRIHTSSPWYYGADGSEQPSSAYLFAPWRDPDTGRVHAFWMLNDTTEGETLGERHDVLYAYSDDWVTWHTSDGSSYSLPITKATAELAQAVPVHQGMSVVTCSACVADDGRPIAAYMCDLENDGKTQFYVTHKTSTGWQTHCVTSWVSEWRQNEDEGTVHAGFARIFKRGGAYILIFRTEEVLGGLGGFWAMRCEVETLDDWSDPYPVTLTPVYTAPVPVPDAMQLEYGGPIEWISVPTGAGAYDGTVDQITRYYPE